MVNKLYKLSINVFYLTAIILMSMFYLTTTVNAETENKEKVKVEQVGTSGGVPAIKAILEGGGDIGTYTLVIVNPKTSEVYSQVLNKSGKPVTFAITNFTENGTYPYTVQVNGLEIIEGGVNLVSTKRVPTFNAQLVGTDLTIDVSRGNDQVGKVIHFKTGSYSSSFQLNSETMQRAFENVTGAGDTITFSDEKGELATVNLVKKGSTGDSNGGANAGGGTGGNTNTGSKDDGVVTLPPTTVKPPTGSNGSNGGGTVTNANNKISIALNQKSYKIEDTIVATIKVTNGSYAGRSVTVRIGADDNSTTVLVDLNSKGEGSAEVKLLVPQPSSKVISASVYTISGSLLDSASSKYGVENEVEGGSGIKDDGKVDKDVPFAEYVSLDLTSLETQKATLAWYKARNISKYPTKLKVINETTNSERTYSVFMPDGDSKIDLNLVYDGPGVYMWELHSGGRLVTKAPFSTPIGVDGTPVSQNGLPVLKTLVNKDVYLSELDGKNPSGVGGADIGEEIGGVVADDFTGDLSQEGMVPVQPENSKKKIIIVFGLAILAAIICVVLIVILKRKSNEESDNDKGYKKFEDEEEGESASEKLDEFEDAE